MAGRKNKYITHVQPKLILIEGWCREGLIEKDIAKKLGVAYSTFRKYKNEYSALSAALKKGKEIADYEVENSLFKRAVGYEYEEKKVINYINEDGTEREFKREVQKKQVPPDVTAQIFWLKNRKPDKWRDKQEIEHSGDLNIKVSIPGVDDES